MPLKAKELNDYLQSLCEVEEPSVDRIIVGNPDTEIRGIGTAWMVHWKTCRQGVAEGVNVMVVHEGTFYTDWDQGEESPEFINAPSEAWEAYSNLIGEKKKWIEEHGLVIIRCHDVLDKVPEFGIPFALGNALGFSERNIVRSRPYYNVYNTNPQPAKTVSKEIAEKLSAVGQPGVAFYGDPDRMVSSVGLGTGFICNPILFMDLKPDLFVAIDDIIHTCVQAHYAEDTGHPLIVINHGTSEEFGMRSLCNHLKEAFPAYETIHLNQGCGYKWIPA